MSLGRNVNSCDNISIRISVEKFIDGGFQNIEFSVVSRFFCNNLAMNLPVFFPPSYISNYCSYPWGARGAEVSANSLIDILTFCRSDRSRSSTEPTDMQRCAGRYSYLP